MYSEHRKSIDIGPESTFLQLLPSGKPAICLCDPKLCLAWKSPRLVGIASILRAHVLMIRKLLILYQKQLVNEATAFSALGGVTRVTLGKMKSVGFAGLSVEVR